MCSYVNTYYLPTTVPRTLYAKGFPEDEDRALIATFFAQYGTVYKVMKRHYGSNADGTKKSKPSVYVQFSTVEEMQKAIDASPEYKDVKLEMLTKEQHMSQVC